MDTTTTQSELPFQKHDLIANRYEIVNVVGKGGMGMVFQVIDHALDNDLIALKIIYTHLVQDEIVFARFRNEVLVARKLSHPNIVRLYDFGYAGFGSYFISMEYVEGVSLSNRIYGPKEKRLSFDEMIFVLHQVSAGMQHAHSKGVVHRDLKPDNILLSIFGDVKITDLGLARSLDIDKGFTNTGETVGTPYYMAPEQIRGSDPDKRSDIYSLGIMAYELVSGRRPFYDDCWFTLAAMHLNQPLPKMVCKDLELPRWFEDFVKICTAKDPNHRFQSFDEVVDLLEEHIPGRNKNRSPAIWLGLGLKNKASKVRRSESRFWKRAFTFSVIILATLFLLTSSFRLSPPLQQHAGSFVLELEQRNGWHLSWLKKLIGNEAENSNEAYWRYIRSGDARRLAIVLGAGKSPNENSNNNLSALHEAIVAGDGDVVSTLISFGADVNARDSQGQSALIKAIALGKANIANLLIQANAALDLADDAGKFPLMHAVVIGDLRLINELLSRGSFVNPQDSNGFTALHFAAQSGNEEIIRTLLDKSADINRADRQGNTPLMLAIINKHPGAMRLLLVRGANQRLKNNRGESPFDLAKDQPELKQILLTPGSN